MIDKGGTTLNFYDVTDPDYVGTEQTWQIQVSPQNPGTTQLAYVNPAAGSNSQQIGDFTNALVTITALGPDNTTVPTTPHTVILDATGYANFSFTPVSASNISYQAHYPGDAAWAPSTGTLENEIGAGWARVRVTFQSQVEEQQ